VVPSKMGHFLRKYKMIIDCHGHYTTAPQELTDYRDNQKKELENDHNFE